ncbi:hypothetical protein Daus18300_013114 [Diaporthe australafricana]|uniref:Uncharacterized protein n=1 Tax=Diaporthe australafricana TaxID=127596 RepID=A0ABR3W0C9_9PEZI
MPYLQGTDTSSESALVTVPLGKLQRRFYEPLILLLALTEAYIHIHNQAPRTPDPRVDVPSHSPEELFQDFINKLCQICDNKPGGGAVTAISALEYPDRVQYRFASNQRSEIELSKVKSYLIDILDTLKGYSTTSSLRVRASLLRKIVAFNRPRLQRYIRVLHQKTQICLETPEIPAELSDALRELRELAYKADNREAEESEFFRDCANLILFIKGISKSTVQKSLQEKAGSDSRRPSPWAELRHASGRLLSYLQASKTLIEARRKWESLLDDFEVYCVCSSTQIPNPINNKDVNAEVIIGRMTNDATIMSAFRAGAEDLQKFNLDQNIKEQATKFSFRPYVHAEVLIHQSILDEFGTTGLRSSLFFKGYRYIGSSKPTCRLCDYYFTASGTGIEVRESHRNLYVNWRAPDVFINQGGAAADRRKHILNKMLERIREDTFRTLSDKIPEKKQFDSNTDPTFPARNLGTSVGSERGWRDADFDDIAESMNHLDLRGSSREVQVVRPEPSPRACGFDGGDDDDDAGGASLG